MVQMKRITGAIAAIACALPLVAAGPPATHKYPNELARKTAQDHTNNENDIQISVLNQSNEPIWVWAEINYNDGQRYSIADPENPSMSKIKLYHEQSIEMTHFDEPAWRAPDGSKFSGSVRALRGCDEMGENCADAADAATKWEFAADPGGHANNVGINLSLVDGFNVPGYFKGAKGSICKEFKCEASNRKVRAHCPRSHFRNNSGFLQCLSDCKMTGSWEHCQSETIPSSHHLKEICRAGYVWSADHEGTYDDCNPKGDLLVVIT